MDTRRREELVNIQVDLTKRCSQPLDAQKRSFHMIPTLPLQIQLALASDG